MANSIKNSFLILTTCIIINSCGSTNVNVVEDSSNNETFVALPVVKDDSGDIYGNMELLASIDSIEIYRELIKEPLTMKQLSRYNVYKINKETGNKSKILTTNDPYSYKNFDMQAKRFVEVCIDSIPFVSTASIIELNPLKVILEGCPDSRNEYSFLVDVDKNRAYYVPAVSGYLGPLEEGLLVFRSYAYNTGVDAAGRHTILKIFNLEGKFLDSIDLEYLQKK